jgi:hypothetical protein
MTYTYESFYFPKINNFADAEARYNNVKPLRGNSNDIRPLGKRTRKHERITKLDDDCYALLEYGTGTDMDWDGGMNSTTREEVRMLAPILWERHPDGTETIRVRNESSIGHGGHHSRYSFLQRALPNGLTWRNNNGKHFIRNGGADHGHFLPFSSTVPAYKNKDNNNHYYSPARGYTTTDDHHYLKFRNDGAQVFSLVSTGHPIPQPPRIVVDKEAKATFKPVYNAFWDWLIAMGPMLQMPKGWKEHHEWQDNLRVEVNSWCGEDTSRRKHILNSYSNMTFTAKLNKDIMRDDNHELRVVLLKQLTRHLELHDVKSKEDTNKVRTLYNRWVNKNCGFTLKQTDYEQGE